MSNPSGFSDILKQRLSWHKARIDCLPRCFPTKSSISPRSKTPFPERPSRNPSIAVCSVSLPGILSAEPMLPASSSRFSAGKTSASPSTAQHGNTANPVSTSWCLPSSGVVSLSRYCGKRWIKNEWFCWNFSVRPFQKSISKPSMLTGSSLAINGWRICVKQGFHTAFTARKTRR